MKSSQTSASKPEAVIEPGDHVHHHPTGEDWIVRRVIGDRLEWCGWPPGQAALSDCELIAKGTPLPEPSPAGRCTADATARSSETKGNL